MSDPVETQLDECAADFVAAARLVRARSAEAAMVRLLPLHLAEDELAVRVYVLVAVGAVTTARLGPAAVADLIAAHHTEPVDLLVGLVGLFARLDR